MSTGLSLTVTTRVRAPLREVWGLLVDPARLGELFWGCTMWRQLLDRMKDLLEKEEQPRR